jgi:hypothetical protein
LTSLALHHCLRPSAPSLAQASPPRGPLLQSLQLALHTCNRSIEPSLVLIFSTLVTWLNVMSHMQWAPSSHQCHVSIYSGTPPLKPENLFPRSSIADFKGKERGMVELL